MKQQRKKNGKRTIQKGLALLCGSLILGCAAMSTTGCGGAASERAAGGSVAGGKDTVVIAMAPTSEPEAGFDPSYGWGAGEHVHEPLIQSTLTVTTADLDIAYDLAAGLSVSEDGLVWTATLRGDVKFTDGEPLTAHDVAFTYNLVKENSTVNDFTMLDHAEAIDDTTVMFYLNRPYSIWPYSMANVGIVPEHAYTADYGQKPVGSGRYILSQWDKGQQVILTANPDYYGEAPNIKKVVVVFMEEDAAFAAVQAGQVDLAYTAAAYTENAPAGYELLSVATVDNRGINLPAVPKENGVGNDFTCDVAVRRAINMGIDRREMIEHVLYGHGTEAYSVCDQLPWGSECARVEYDPQEAAKLLDEAGWIVGEDGVRQKEGIRAELNLLYPAGDSLRQAIAADAANQLKELGIASAFEGVGWDTAYDRAQSEPLVWGWGAHTPMEMYNIYHTAPGGTLAAYSPYADAEVDRLMEAALAAGEEEKSRALWKQAQEYIAQDVPWVWLVNVDHLYWCREGLAVAPQKLHPHGHGWSIVNNVDRWSWE